MGLKQDTKSPLYKRASQGRYKKVINRPSLSTIHNKENKKLLTFNRSRYHKKVQSVLITDKTVSCICYFTFGLAGIVYIFLGFLAGKKPEKLSFVCSNTISSIKLGAGIALGSFFLKLLMISTPFIIKILELYAASFINIVSVFQTAAFTLACILAIRCLFLENSHKKRSHS